MKGFSARLLLLILLQSTTLTAVAQKATPSEWITPKQTYYRFPIAKTGFYKLTGLQLFEAGIPLDSIPASAFQIFRRGRELAIEVNQDSASKLARQGSITFYACHNDGAQDSALYINTTAFPNSHYSLYSDTASYFLTWRTDGGAGKRIQLARRVQGIDTLQYHVEQILNLYNSFYAPGNFYPPGSSFDSGIALSTYDVGEGWTGTEIKAGDWSTFTIQTNNADQTHFASANIELVLVSRSAGNHEVELRIGSKNAPGRLITKAFLTNYAHTIVRAGFDKEDLSADGKLTVSVVPASKSGSVSVSAIQWQYPQNTDLSPQNIQKAFYFDKSHVGKIWKLRNAGDLLFYDCTDEFNVKRVQQVSDAIPVGEATKIFTVRTFLTINSIKKAVFQPIDSLKTDYLIITHPLLRTHSPGNPDPVNAYAAYRSSAVGGGFKPLTINIQEVYDRFNYGDPGPLGIRNMIKWLNKNDVLRFVFLIGKSIDPQTSRKQANPRTADMVPNAGWPGSDLALAMETNDEPASYVPSVPIGRINASTPGQVWNYLQKVKKLESEPAFAHWRKNILHLSGGRSASELTLFREYVRSFENQIKNTSLAASVSTISKKNDDPVEQFPLHVQLNKGIALMTLFGHSGVNVTDIDIGFASDVQRSYANAPFFPAVIVNGCATGSIFYSSQTISSDWIFTPESGSVLFLAHTFNGISTALKRYTAFFYEVLADSLYSSQPFGDIQQEAIRRNMQQAPGIADFTTVQQMNLHGDPAIRIFPAHFPDYHFDSTLFALSGLGGKPLSEASDSIVLRIGVTNDGRFKNEKYKLLLTVENDVPAVQYTFDFSPVAIADTLQLTIPNPFKSSEYARLHFSIDPQNRIHEENELNNVLTREINLPQTGVVPLLPINGYITDIPQVELVAQLPPYLKDTDVTFSWDFSDTFSNEKTVTVLASGAIARLPITLPENHEGDIYWQAYLPADRAKPHKNRKFSFIQNASSSLKLPEVVVSIPETRTIIQEGDIFEWSVMMQNVTNYAFTDSITVKITQSGKGGNLVQWLKIAPLNSNETRKLIQHLPTNGMQGNTTIAVHFNERQLPELMYQNNIAQLSYTVTADIIPPTLTVSVDNRLIHDNEVVQARPSIGVQVSDENRFLIPSDTTGIYVGIRPNCLNCREQRLNLASAIITKTKPNHFLIKVSPALPLKPGSYVLVVKARDVSGNMAPEYQVRILISEAGLIADAGVSPNPSQDYFRFFTNIEDSQASGTWSVSLRNLSGIEIKKMEQTIHPGQNELFWQPADLPPGIILYQIQLPDRHWQFSPAAKKGMSGKLIRMP